MTGDANGAGTAKRPVVSTILQIIGWLNIVLGLTALLFVLGTLPPHAAPGTVLATFAAGALPAVAFSLSGVIFIAAGTAIKILADIRAALMLTSSVAERRADG